ncbi:PTS sugar transporter subunit IIA [Vibrio sp. T11.5]|uniref:PTS sugar transporter subunit IIA n=1 Tax=Vibrio sp. T11.5 TaxID=2998836 RepID=UPI0022CD58C6|nr:PTS sugar transporter subunit IIA [Vibrio sp. T11.5]MDA0118961.1 PTS sugar transporter subunit IIA [Vibrio sp. T11.5]
MIERRITFVLPEDGFASWKINRLKALSGMFRSVVVLLNVTKWERANIEHPLQIMSLGSQEFDLCQIHIEGSDAELACMVFTNFISDQFTLVNTAHKSNQLTNIALLSNLPTFHLDFPLSYLHHHSEIDTKSAAFRLATKCITSSNPALICEQFAQREQTSSTAIGHGIALPHIMSEAIDIPSISIVSLTEELDWNSPVQGGVSMIIAIALPHNASRDVLLAFTRLTRSLLDPDYCQLLRTSHEPQALKALLTHKLAQA